MCATSGVILAVQELGSLGLKLAGSAEQKGRFLPRLASGEWLAAYALTEAGSGSDSAAMRTTARRDGDVSSIHASERFITNAGVASVYTVFAKTEPEARDAGITAFVVEADTPGFDVARLEPKMGLGGSTTGELVFDGARVPATNRLGEGRGVQARHALLIARVQGSRRRRWGSPRVRLTARSSTRERARRWGNLLRSIS